MNKLPLPVSTFLKQDDERISIVRSFTKKKTSEELGDIVKQLLFDEIIPYYSNIRIKATQGLYNFLIEPVRNANFHGARDEGWVTFGIYLSLHGLVGSFNDGGTYFMRSDVKKSWEAKELHPEKHRIQVEGLGGGAGQIMIFDMSDLIYVDEKTGTLYTGLSINTDWAFQRAT